MSASAIEVQYRPDDLDESAALAIRPEGFAWALGDERGRLVVVTRPTDPTEPVTYLEAFQLPASPATTDPQLNPIAVPKGARGAKVFFTYALGAGGDAMSNSASLEVYLSYAEGVPLFNYNAQGISSVGSTQSRATVLDVGGCALLGFAATEDGGPNPGLVTIVVVFY